MVRCCCVKGCENRSNHVFGLSFHSIPAIISNHGEALKQLTARRRQLWLRAIGQEDDWDPAEQDKVCSEHFVYGRPASVEDEQDVDWVPSVKVYQSMEVAANKVMNQPDVIVNSRWEDWRKFVNSIVEFINTGKVDKTLSQEKQDELAEAARVYYIESGTLYRRKKKLTRKVVTTIEERDLLLEKCHKGEPLDEWRNADPNVSPLLPHADAEATAAAIKSQYFWKGVRFDVAELIRHCTVCSPLTAVVNADNYCFQDDSEIVIFSGSEEEECITTTIEETPKKPKPKVKSKPVKPPSAPVAKIKPSKSASLKVSPALFNFKKKMPAVVDSTPADVTAINSGTLDKSTEKSKKMSVKVIPAESANKGVVKTVTIKKSDSSSATKGNKSQTVGSSNSNASLLKVHSSKSKETAKSSPFTVTAAVSKTPAGNVTILTTTQAEMSETSTVSYEAHSKPLLSTGMSNMRIPQTAATPTPTQVMEASNLGPKSYRPVAWMLHSIGIRMVRERVYGDLIDIQEEKDADGQLGPAEQSQLCKLRSAYNEIKNKNTYLTNDTELHYCRCGFSALLDNEMENHHEYGCSTTSLETGHFKCCTCGAKFVRQQFIMAHNERVHGRHARSYPPPLPPGGVCPYCPFEQKTATKVKLAKHIERCKNIFSLDRNLMLPPRDCDFPLIDTRPSSILTTPTTSTTVAVQPSVTSVASAVTSQLVSTSAIATTNTTTVTATGEPVTSAIETGSTEPFPTPKGHLSAKLKSKLLLHAGPQTLQFMLCELCGAFVRSRCSLFLHLAVAHKIMVSGQYMNYENPPERCTKCVERFWTPAGLEKHIKRMHGSSAEDSPGPITVCPLCHRTRITDVLEHLARQHRITLVDMFLQRYCAICQLSLRAADPFEYHMLSRHSDVFADRASFYATLVTIDRCTRGRSFMLQQGRQTAQLAGVVRKTPLLCESASADDAAWKCSSCSVEFPDEIGLTAHVAQYHKFTCSACDRRFSTAKFLRIHTLKAHADETESCRLCDEEICSVDNVEHMLDEHTRPCCVVVKRDSFVDGSALEMTLLRGCKRPRSDCSDSEASFDEEMESGVDRLEHEEKRCKVISE